MSSIASYLPALQSVIADTCKNRCYDYIIYTCNFGSYDSIECLSRSQNLKTALSRLSIINAHFFCFHNSPDNNFSLDNSFEPIRLDVSLSNAFASRLVKFGASFFLPYRVLCMYIDANYVVHDFNHILLSPYSVSKVTADMHLSRFKLFPPRTILDELIYCLQSGKLSSRSFIFSYNLLFSHFLPSRRLSAYDNSLIIFTAEFKHHPSAYDCVLEIFRIFEFVKRDQLATELIFNKYKVISHCLPGSSSANFFGLTRQTYHQNSSRYKRSLLSLILDSFPFFASLLRAPVYNKKGANFFIRSLLLLILKF